ncbi:MAG: aminotransferase class IV [Phycisphaerae bacterium]|nr:aminotransferase class IV [Phycisphaerae bacterium]
MKPQGDATVFISGRFESVTSAHVSAMDAAVQHGVGLFETMLGGVDGDHGPWIVHLHEHVESLSASARALGLHAGLREGALAEAALETVRRAGLALARVRITITGGRINGLAAARGGGPPERPDPTVIIAAQPATTYPRALQDTGIRIAVADARANPFNPTEGHKTINYWWRLRELAAASAKDCGEALVLSVTNHACGGCVSNVLVVRGGAVFTPIARGEEGTGALPSPVRPGVVRSWALQRLRDGGRDATPKMLSIADVLDADEVMLTNRSWGVLGVSAVEGRTIGGGGPGPVCRGLMADWERLVSSRGLEP